MRASAATERPPGHLSLAEAAERIGMHPRSLLRIIREAKAAGQKPPLTPFARPTWRARQKFWFPVHQVERFAVARQTLRS